ncbi:transposase [Pseudooceanicola spongiae]|uniref:Transposase n=2 Tax=Pseudooceanicola spongiae TaxID=2613965 RepID=A0A7L9WRM3_9RHOB|nr:transposase [Pseudooceanicola spongiae]
MTTLLSLSARCAGRCLPKEKLRFLRALTSKRAQILEMHKHLLAQIRPHQKPGAAEMFDSIDTELKALLERLIKELEDRIGAAISSDDLLAETSGVLRSIPGIGPVASAMLIAEMTEPGTVTREQAPALVGLAPVAQTVEPFAGSEPLQAVAVP